MRNQMKKASKQRNIITTVCLWLAILVNLAMTVGFMVVMYETNLMEETLGLGLCSMFTFANVLGLILLMRWNKIGLSLITISVVLLSIVYIYVLKLGFIPILPFIGSIVFLWLILQIRKGGKSAWSQLKSGWDGKHCQHLYQCFAVVELILFILTLLAFGSNKNGESNIPPSAVLQDTIVVVRKNPVENSIRDSIPDADSIKKGNLDPKSMDEKSDKDESKKPKQAENEPTPEKNTNKTSSLDEAARYLDSHKVWKMTEMSHYQQISNLNIQIIKSVREGRDRISVSCPSSKLRKIRTLLNEIERLSRDSDGDPIHKYMKSYWNQSQIRPDDLINQLKIALRYIRAHATQRKPTGTGEEESSDGGSNQKKRIQKEFDDYTKKVLDSIRVRDPAFGLE